MYNVPLDKQLIINALLKRLYAHGYPDAKIPETLTCDPELTAKKIEDIYRDDRGRFRKCIDFYMMETNFGFVYENSGEVSRRGELFQIFMDAGLFPEYNEDPEGRLGKIGEWAFALATTGKELISLHRDAVRVQNELFTQCHRLIDHIARHPLDQNQPSYEHQEYDIPVDRIERINQTAEKISRKGGVMGREGGAFRLARAIEINGEIFRPQNRANEFMDFLESTDPNAGLPFGVSTSLMALPFGSQWAGRMTARTLQKEQIYEELADLGYVPKFESSTTLSRALRATIGDSWEGYIDEAIALGRDLVRNDLSRQIVRQYEVALLKEQSLPVEVNESPFAEKAAAIPNGDTASCTI